MPVTSVKKKSREKVKEVDNESARASKTSLMVKNSSRNSGITMTNSRS